MIQVNSALGYGPVTQVTEAVAEMPVEMAAAATVVTGLVFVQAMRGIARMALSRELVIDAVQSESRPGKHSAQRGSPGNSLLM